MKPHIGVAGLALMAATLVACGGGGASPFVAPPSSSTSAWIALSTTGTTPVTLSTISNGSSAVVTFPEVSAAAHAKVTLQSSLPSGATQPQARTIATKSRIANAIGGANLDVLDYVAVTLDSTVSVTSTPAFSFALGSPIASGSSAYIAVLDLNNASSGWNVLTGPGTISGSTVTFAAQSLAPQLTLQSNDTYVFALVATTSTITPPPPTLAPNTAASYSGTKSVNYSYGFGYTYPQPVPSATAPPTTLNYTVTANVSVGKAKFPGSTTAQLVDEHVAESDASNLSSTTYATDSWISVASASKTYNEVLYGVTQQEPSSANLPVSTTVYGSPQIIDEFPESSSNTWHNSPAATMTYNYASGDAGTRQIGADGTYVDTEQMGPSSTGETVTMTENKDGSGSIVGPIEGGFITSISVSAPSPVPSATPVITITEAIGQFYQTNYGYPATLTKTDGRWYTPTSQYYTENDTVKTAVSLPNGCTPSPYSSANEVVRKITDLDTVIGYLETTEFDSYNVDGFPVCMVTSDVQSFAYGQQGLTPSIFAVGPLGLEVITTNETLALQNGPPSAQAGAARAQAVAHAASFIGALQAHQLNAFQQERVVRKRAFLNHINGGQQ